MLTRHAPVGGRLGRRDRHGRASAARTAPWRGSRRACRASAADSRAEATGRPRVPTAIQVSPGPGVDEPRKKKSEERKNEKEKTSPPASPPSARATRIARSKHARSSPDSEDASAMITWMPPKKINGVRVRVRTADRFRRGGRDARREERVPFLEDASTRSRRHRESDDATTSRRPRIARFVRETFVIAIKVLEEGMRVGGRGVWAETAARRVALAIVVARRDARDGVI